MMLTRPSYKTIENSDEDDIEAMDLKWDCRAPRSKEAACLIRVTVAERQVQTNTALMAFSDSELDLSYPGLDEFKEPEFKGYGHKNIRKRLKCQSSFVKGYGSNTSKSVSEVEPKKVRKNNDALIIEDWVSDDEEQDESNTKPEKKTVILQLLK
ncbi:hypothetical protein Tco_0693604 [Tanacetum coccineum]